MKLKYVKLESYLFNKLILITCLTSLCALNNGCSKNDQIIDETDTITNRNVDSIIRYAKEIYYWNEFLPSIDELKNKASINKDNSPLSLYKNTVNEITKSAIDQSTGFSFEHNILQPEFPKYSTILTNYNPIIQKENKNQINIQQNPFGLSITILNDKEVYILYVDKNSPSGKQNLKRGDKIISINDTKITSIDQFEQLWKSAIQLDFAKLQIEDMERNIKTIRLYTSHFEKNPLLKYNTILSNNRKFGFLALNSFEKEEITIKSLTSAFNYFKTENITDMIIDLRYNQGGYQNSVSYIANQIAPISAEGKVMFSEVYNKTMQNKQAIMLKNQPILDEYNNQIKVDNKLITLFDIDYSREANTTNFKNTGEFPLLKKIYFIISEQTASASELLINVIKPHMDIELIGVTTQNNPIVRTYGKPIGFFDIRIGDYSLFLAMYNLRNSMNEGDYYNGFTANRFTWDDPHYDFGSEQDPAIQLILNKSTLKSKSIKTKKLNYIFNNDRLSGTIKTGNDLIPN